MRYCGQCGSPNTESARFCTNCGAKLSEVIPYVTEGVNDHSNEAVNVSIDGDVTTKPVTEPALDPEESVAKDPVTTAIPASPEVAESAESGKISVLSILAFIFSFLIPIAGLIMGIIDLCMSDGRKKGMSIAAVVISACFIAIFVVTMLTVIIPLTSIIGTF